MRSSSSVKSILSNRFAAGFIQSQVHNHLMRRSVLNPAAEAALLLTSFLHRCYTIECLMTRQIIFIRVNSASLSYIV